MSADTTELTTTRQSNGHGLVPASVADALRLAEVMCKGRLVPQHLQNSVADCLMVIEQAARWGLSPFAVAQSTSVIQGKLMFEGKLVAAVINARGDLSKRLDFEYSGAGNDRKVRAFGTLRGEDKPREVEVWIKDVKTTNRMWQTQPDQQLAYASTRIWARRHVPELMLGVYAPEEFQASQEPEYTAPPKAQSTTAPTNGSNGAADSGASTAAAGVSDAVVLGAGQTPMTLEEATAAAVEPEYEPASTMPEEYTEPVSVYDPKTGEEVGRKPRLTTAQRKQIHVLLDRIGHHMDDFTRGKDGQKGAIVERGKYRRKLKEKFSKESTADLSIGEASWVIDWLLMCLKKIEARMDRGNEGMAPSAEREPGSDG